MTVEELMTAARNLRACFTVGELIAALKTLPPDLEVRQGFEDGVTPAVFNAKTDAHLSFEECEPCEECGDPDCHGCDSFGDDDEDEEVEP